MASQEDLMRIREQKRSLYDVRTRFLDDRGEPVYTNHLVQEDSPYLLQHAHNPVDWYPWGEEAFVRAAAENKPVFLSIGYSTCHWCHVMEEESFDDEEVGEVLNRHFISIKLDREQRPDLDEIYMTCVQLLSGHGGWPMSSFLTPEGKPFFGATYFPKDQFISLLTRVSKIWMEDRPTLVRDAEKLDGLIRQQLAPAPAAPLPDGLAEQVAEHLVHAVDRQYGGFGDAPKFPQEPNLMLLLELIQRDPQPLAEQRTWSVLSKTLDAMLRGGIYDQVGGGFARYSTDRRWLVPHFEKMLYNQGQLAGIYLWAWQLSGEREYRRIVEETLDYLLREMRSTTGGFYSATDADSEGEEGKYFVWHYDELAELLPPGEMALCEAVYGVTRSGNFEGANILYLPRPLDQVAELSGIDRGELDQALDSIKKRLYEVRLQRVPPLRDNKQITEWNGMVIAALAQAGEAFGRQDYLDAAILAVEDLWLHHHEEDRGILWRTSLSGTASIRAVLDDYAHFLNALIALYDATGEGLWLDRAQNLTGELQAHYWDEDEGGFFITPRTTVGPQLVRSKNLMDGATVSGNSLILRVLIALYRRTGALQLKPFIERQIQAFSGRISQSPIVAPVFLQGLLEWDEPAPGPLQYAAGGAIRLRCRSESLGDSGRRLSFTLEMRSGWHVQSHQPANKERVPTTVRILNPEDWQEVEVAYPEPENGPMGTGVTPELIYTGTVTVTLEARSELSAARPLLIELQVQPCTETECLLPERRSFLLHG